MEDVSITHYLEHMAGAIAKFVLLAFVLPLLPVFIFNLSLPATIALITSTFVIEYGAAPRGIGLGLPPVFVFYVLVCIAAGVIFLLYDIFDTLGQHSERIARFLKKSGDRAQQSSMLSKYGIYGLTPCVMTLGFYICPPIAWVLGWRRDLSILLTMAGYIAISLVTVLLSQSTLYLLFR